MKDDMIMGSKKTCSNCTHKTGSWLFGYECRKHGIAFGDKKNISRVCNDWTNRHLEGMQKSNFREVE